MPLQFSPSTKKIIPIFLPCLYFVAFFIWMYIDNRRAENTTLLPLILVIPFAAQLFLRKKYLAISLGVITLLLSFYLVLAFFSDFARIDDYGEAPALKFIIAGSFVLIGNFLISVLLLNYPGHKRAGAFISHP